jgi:hypothetical protein
MLEQIRKHLQTWLAVPSPHPLQDQIQSLQDRMDFLERMMTDRPVAPETPPDRPRDDLSQMPDAHLGAH